MRSVLVLTALVLLIGLASCVPKRSNAPRPVPQAPATTPQASQGTPAAPVPAPTPGGAAWPRFRGANADGVSGEKGINTDWKGKLPTQRWSTVMHDDGYSGPAVADGVLYILDHEGKQDIVRALAMADGAERWRYAYDDAERDNYGFTRSTPAVAGGRVFTIGASGMVSALDAGTGKLVWSRTMSEFAGKKPQWNYSMSPLVDGDRVIIIPGGPSAVAALDAATGKTVWQGGGDGVPGYATPVAATLNGTKQYLIFTAFGLLSVDARDGKKLWAFPWKTGCDVNAPTPIPIKDSVFITSGYGHGCALLDVTPGGAKARWQNKEMQSQMATPVYADGFIYGTTDPGDLVCLDAATGKVRWRQKGFEKGGVVAVDGYLIAQDGANGQVNLLKLSPASYQLLGSMAPLDGQSWTAPIVAEGCLIVRNKGTLACLNLK
jgi:outer membrane protein assembly factor BamB